MKKHLLVLVVVFSSLISCTQEKTTTYYLIRHAEKDRTDVTNKNPNLNDKGLERAKKWATYFKDINLDAVYSTNYNRTMQTAKPTVESKGLQVLSYSPRKLFDKKFQKETKGKTVLIVGHSNTTPFFANKILGKDKYQQIDDNNNANLYIITVNGSKTSVLLKND
ncbi:SixA phosphatase family protein [Tenacibaculum retecalamus]|uniref:SixA phosphatase family protein n=1 Tax=Tenacibaculum retecalamus TaxID=3018315 RepID=UPI0023D8FBB6|nr:phosphoglycerate mutase family protein [Tenacibaculum retecalamus]WBX72362.1 phosphoglycerate mutase family protein [Tenacibaculum retecalamus]